jgi:prolyl-tRNA synthetase
MALSIAFWFALYAFRSSLYAFGVFMRLSHLFAKTQKQAPHDADSVNARLLVQAGFVRQEMAGVYSWLPLGLKVLRKVEAIVREEMDKLGAQEILMPALQSKEAWTTTQRWDAMDVLFKLNSQTDKEYALGPTHEEVVTPLIQSFVKSYKDLPTAVYQIQTKYRDELRAKSGVLRGREFGMKDLYSFHLTQEDLEAFYARALETYLRIYQRCGLDARAVEASGGSFSQKLSHEFQVFTPAGEDTVLLCEACSFAQNAEVATVKEGDACPSCGKTVVSKTGIEVGNIFDLNTKFTDAFKFGVQDEKGEQQRVLMGCYGLGTTRLVGAIVETCNDERGIVWPMSVTPFHVSLISLKSKDADVQARINEASQDLVEKLEDEGVAVLWDDREDLSAGGKFADADLMGLPLRLVLSEKTLAESSVEWKERKSDDAHLIKLEDVVEKVGELVKG